MAYLLWRVMAGLNEEVTISFLLVGHTKFVPDQGFGLFKRVFKRNTVGTIHDIADVVRKSAVLNHPQLIGDYDGTTFVKFYDWSSTFEEHTTAIKGISQYQHFRMSSSDPWVVFVKTTSNGKETKINILRPFMEAIKKYNATIGNSTRASTTTPVVFVQ